MTSYVIKEYESHFGLNKYENNICITDFVLF